MAASSAASLGWGRESRPLPGVGVVSSRSRSREGKVGPVGESAVTVMEGVKVGLGAASRPSALTRGVDRPQSHPGQHSSREDLRDSALGAPGQIGFTAATLIGFTHLGGASLDQTGRVLGQVGPDGAGGQTRWAGLIPAGNVWFTGVKGSSSTPSINKVWDELLLEGLGFTLVVDETGLLAERVMDTGAGVSASAPSTASSSILGSVEASRIASSEVKDRPRWSSEVDRGMWPFVVGNNPLRADTGGAILKVNVRAALV